MNTVPSIRQATSSDYAKLKEIIDLSFPRFFRYFALESVNSKDGKVLLIEVQGQTAGFAKLITFTIRNEFYGCLLWIAVHPNYRRHGFAFQLTNAGVNNLKDEGAHAVFASTQRRNKAELAALAKSGFKRAGFLGLWRLFGWRVFQLYSDIWLAPGEVVLMYK